MVIWPMGRDAGSDERSGSLFGYVDLEAQVRADHPLRVIRDLANAALGDLSGEFSKLYTDFGRPSIAREKLLRAMLLQCSTEFGRNGI
jgi:transposase